MEKFEINDEIVGGKWSRKSYHGCYRGGALALGGLIWSYLPNSGNFSLNALTTFLVFFKWKVHLESLFIFLLYLKGISTLWVKWFHMLNGFHLLGRGQWGEGITGTTIKDTGTKSRGRVEVGEGGGFRWGGVEGWGEKAHNCNWITKKKFKQQQRKYKHGLPSVMTFLEGWSEFELCSQTTFRVPTTSLWLKGRSWRLLLKEKRHFSAWGWQAVKPWEKGMANELLTLLCTPIFSAESVSRHHAYFPLTSSDFVIGYIMTRLLFRRLINDWLVFLKKTLDYYHSSKFSLWHVYSFTYVFRKYLFS